MKLSLNELNEIINQKQDYITNSVYHKEANNECVKWIIIMISDFLEQSNNKIGCEMELKVRGLRHTLLNQMVENNKTTRDATSRDIALFNDYVNGSEA